MAKRRMTKIRLLAELRKLLAKPCTQVIERRQRICGQSTWEYEKQPDGSTKVWNIRIYLDPRRDGRVRLVIHELLHCHMATHLGIDERMVYELEEAAILAWENKLYAWLHDAKRASALESWNKAIERKKR